MVVKRDAAKSGMGGGRGRRINEGEEYKKEKLVEDWILSALVKSVLIAMQVKIKK